MSKLPEAYRFIDLSDYGRSTAIWIVGLLSESRFTPIHLTTAFIVSGFLAILFILIDIPIAAAFFLILKSILDAADGELARLRNTPSYVGRYYDSIADIILNFCFLTAFWHVTNSSLLCLIIAFISLQLQGTLYNYYHVILRNNVRGDTTSRIFEDSPPKAAEGESQHKVDIYFNIFYALYVVFDKAIYYLDREARYAPPFPKWFMTMVSIFGLGFQLLIMAVMLVLNLESYVIPFFIGYSALIFLFVGIRRWALS